MGAISSCCSAEPADSKEAIPSGPPANEKAALKRQPSAKSEIAAEEEQPQPPTAPKAVSDVDIETFQRRIENSMDVVVLLADGTKLACQLKLNTPEKSLVISCDTNLRVIPLSELKAILHGRDQLRRVETKANLVDDPNCIALHMVTGNCIPVHFEELNDKSAFIELIKQLK